MVTNPRTAIGEISPLHYVMVVADGRTSESTGLSLYELAEFMEALADTEVFLTRVAPVLAESDGTSLTVQYTD